MVTSAVDWPINCIEVPPIWASSSGKLVITGDAAHAMVPYMALGAAMAVEDAAAMAATLTHLRSKDDLKTAVSKWVEARKPRVKQIHEASYGHGLILHLPDGPVQEARDQALRPEVEGKAVMESPNQWSDPVMSHFAYSHDPVAEIERIWGE
jgi:salicylate hydroxylase